CLDAALDTLVRVRLDMLLGHVDAFDQHTIVAAQFQHRAATAAILARIDDDFVTLANTFGAHSTSGASEMMRMNFSRNSRVTGPKIRVPTGSFWFVSKTAALRSKRMTEPSLRRTPLRVRTTTAFNTSPFFTRPRGMASLTVTLMMSPTRA